jgi:hypothetical protein
MAALQKAVATLWTLRRGTAIQAGSITTWFTNKQLCLPNRGWEVVLMGDRPSHDTSGSWHCVEQQERKDITYNYSKNVQGELKNFQVAQCCYQLMYFSVLGQSCLSHAFSVMFLMSPPFPPICLLAPCSCFLTVSLIPSLCCEKSCMLGYLGLTPLWFQHPTEVHIKFRFLSCWLCYV